MGNRAKKIGEPSEPSGYWRPVQLARLSFGMIRITLSDTRSLGPWCIKGTAGSMSRVDSAVLLMHPDLSDLDH